MQDQEIKSLTPVECPHCSKPIVIEFITGAPKAAGVYTPEMLEAAKQEAISRINALGLPEEFTKATMDWIKNPDTIFSPNDIEEIIKNIQKPEGETEDDSEE